MGPSHAHRLEPDLDPEKPDGSSTDRKISINGRRCGEITPTREGHVPTTGACFGTFPVQWHVAGRTDATAKNRELAPVWMPSFYAATQ